MGAIPAARLCHTKYRVTPPPPPGDLELWKASRIPILGDTARLQQISRLEYNYPYIVMIVAFTNFYLFLKCLKYGHQPENKAKKKKNPPPTVFFMDSWESKTLASNYLSRRIYCRQHVLQRTSSSKCHVHNCWSVAWHYKFSPSPEANLKFVLSKLFQLYCELTATRLCYCHVTGWASLWKVTLGGKGAGCSFVLLPRPHTNF